MPLRSPDCRWRDGLPGVWGPFGTSYSVGSPHRPARPRSRRQIRHTPSAPCPWNRVARCSARRADGPRARVAGFHEHEAVEIRAQVPFVDGPTVEEAPRVVSVRRVDRGEDARNASPGRDGDQGQVPVRERGKTTASAPAAATSCAAGASTLRSAAGPSGRSSALQGRPSSRNRSGSPMTSNRAVRGAACRCAGDWCSTSVAPKRPRQASPSSVQNASSGSSGSPSCQAR